MVVLGGYHALVGIAALARGEILLGTPSYTYALDVTTWGWVQLGLVIIWALSAARADSA